MHTEECMFSSPQNAFCFTNLSRLFIEIFRFFENRAQNLIPRRIIRRAGTYRWDLTQHLNG